MLTATHVVPGSLRATAAHAPPHRGGWLVAKGTHATGQLWGSDPFIIGETLGRPIAGQSLVLAPCLWDMLVWGKSGGL